MSHVLGLNHHSNPTNLMSPSLKATVLPK
ncbi:MAG: hypothetical protein IPJ88_02175 [Myxococcales bacterium]|nr:MAG: hypothetical protein IPJ88_02175 [Myxococcales bacterium]